MDFFQWLWWSIIGRCSYCGGKYYLDAEYVGGTLLTHRVFRCCRCGRKKY